ncbi:MAG: FMN-binding protein [Sedimentisphaerales bacterium]|nr:FMN-binding protein [Sedimentisphaerales bacterium]
MGKLKHFIEQSWLLIVSSFVFGLLLAATNYALEPTIRQNRIDKLNRLAKGLLPDAVHFREVVERIELTSSRGKTSDIAVYKGEGDGEKCVGWSFTVSGSGFADRIDLVVAVDAKFENFAGYDVLMSNETPGFGDRIKDKDYYFWKQFKKGLPVGQLKLVTSGDPEKVDSEIVAISGATISSEAVVRILNDTVGQIKEQMAKKGLISNGK